MRKLIGIIAILGLSACGEQPVTESNIADEPDVFEVVADEDAEAVANRLIEAGLPMAGLTSVTEETDSNNLLGRPGGYTSKVFFFDERYEGVGTPPSEQNTIEVFPSEEDATRRREYVDGIAKEMPMFTQYIVQSGNAVLRLNKALKPSEAAEYETALNER